jgi:hypothetical protein
VPKKIYQKRTSKNPHKNGGLERENGMDIMKVGRRGERKEENEAMKMENENGGDKNNAHGKK